MSSLLRHHGSHVTYVYRGYFLDDHKAILDGIRFSKTARVDIVKALADGRYATRTRTLVTPNIYHMKLAADSDAFRDALNDADYVVADGWPVALALGLVSGESSSRIAGVDLAIDVLTRAAIAGARISVVGGSPDANRAARVEVARRWPKLELVGRDAAPLLSSEISERSTRMFAEVLNSGEPDIVLLCFGAPKSEAYLYRARQDVHVGSVLCVGATVDFLAGTKKRAPEFVQRLGIEWLYRLLQEPRRLWKRYTTSGAAFIRIVARVAVTRLRRGRSSASRSGK